MASSSRLQVPIPNGDTSSTVRTNRRRVQALDDAATNHDIDSHVRRRIFLGPMPEKVISHLEEMIRKDKEAAGALTLSQLEAAAPEESDDVLKFVKSHAKRFVNHRGGHSEDDDVESVQTEDTDDWDEDRVQNVAEELIQRWKASEWGQAWSHRHKSRSDPRPPGQWVGGSFEIGCLLGIDLLHGGRSGSHRDESTGVFSLKNSSVFSPAKSTANGSTSRLATTTAQDARKDTPTDKQGSATPESEGAVEYTSLSTFDSRTGLLPLPRAASDGGALLQTKSLPYVDATRTAFSDTHVVTAKDKQRQVHYADSTSQVGLESEAPPPAPPMEVLSRTGSQVEPTTSQAAVAASTSRAAQWGDVIMRDRMLVRVTYSKCEALSPKFDDSINRTTRDLRFEDWAEFMVAWRKDMVEIYEDYSLPGKELVTGRKHLAYVIPLKSSRTNLSMYSFVDLTFCITCPPTSTHINPSNPLSRFNRSKDGTNIFVFKHKSRSRAWDWIWQLWRHLGGQIPQSIYVYNPRLNTKVTIDIPYRKEIDNQELYAMFSRKNITALCMDSLRSVPDWFALVEREITQHGKRLELSWRRDANLDWLWLDEDVYGKSRPWATLSGLAVLQSSRPLTLEIRLTSHAPTHYHLKNGTELDEPPSIEGYVERIRPNTQLKQPLYLSTHDGLLFTNHIHHAYPPAPPGIALTMQDFDSWVNGLRSAEVQRGANQIMHATAVCDLRNIVAVRRAFQYLPASSHDQRDSALKDDSSWFNIWSHPEPCTLDDDEDEGGEGYLAHAGGKTLIRLRRSFELLLNTGNVVRFETYSRRVAIDWVNRLRTLIVFWKHKHRVDAKEEMELVQARRPRLTPQVKVCQDDGAPEAPSDMSGPYPAMENLYNWCIIEGCNPITKGGRVHMRKGLRGQYKMVQMFLVAGHLVCFRIKPGSSLHSMARKKINLLDAYVYSGYLAAMNLPKGQFRTNVPTAARRYQDGLETDDRDEDMLFMICYRAHPADPAAELNPTVAPATARGIPNLSAKQKLAVFQTRSRIERDAWCWALNTEIEKIVRVQKEREEKLRDTGNLMQLDK